MACNSYSITDQNEKHFTTFEIVDWMDIFIINRYKIAFLKLYSSSHALNA